LEDVKDDYLNNVEGFFVPKKEVLLILKQKAYSERFQSPKGQKDKIDILSILNADFNFDFYKKILGKYNLKDCKENLKEIVLSINEVSELDLNKFQYSKLKKKILKNLG